MPVRPLAVCQQEQNCGGSRPAFYLPGIAKRFTVVTAFRVLLESERADHFGCGWHGVLHQNLFFRARISAKTCAAGLPAIPIPEATSGRSARRNGFASFSSPMVAGMVGSFFAICCLACASRAASALLFGSIVRANLIFAAVYSWPQ